jgi:hypothetical protein
MGGVHTASEGPPIKGAAECAYDAYQQSYQRSLRYLKDAQGHCDAAVRALDHAAEGSGKAGTLSQSRIRSVVASETAQTFLSVGILKKDDVFKSYVFEKMNLHMLPGSSVTGAGGGASTSATSTTGASAGAATATDAGAASLEEKERGVLSALETGGQGVTTTHHHSSLVTRQL